LQALTSFPSTPGRQTAAASSGEWVYGVGVPRDQADTAIFFVHGSGYALCSPRTHRRLTSWLSRLTGLPVFSVDYRLAPRHRFPSAADDVRSGWDWLIRDHGRAPERPSWLPTPQAAISPSTCSCSPMSSTRPRWCCSPPHWA
jgi:acetyl esterase/lipase